MPQGAVTVHKAVSLNDAQVDYHAKYTMKITDSDGNAVANAKYYYDNSPTDKKTTDENGRFTLQPGQTAIFYDLDMDKSWKFEEQDPDTELYVDEYVVKDSKGNLTTYRRSDGSYQDWKGISPSTVIGDSDVSLIIDNNFKTADIKVNKEFFIDGEKAEEAPDMNEFNNAPFVLQVYENGEWKDVAKATVSYNSFADGSYTFEDLMIIMAK